MATQENLGIRVAADAAATRAPARTRGRLYARCAMGFAAPILIVSTSFLFGTAARAQNGGYMRALTSHGQVAGESTDPKFNGWIIMRSATLPSAPQIAAMADEAAVIVVTHCSDLRHGPDRAARRLSRLATIVRRQQRQHRDRCQSQTPNAISPDKVSH